MVAGIRPIAELVAGNVAYLGPPKVRPIPESHSQMSKKKIELSEEQFSFTSLDNEPAVFAPSAV